MRQQQYWNEMKSPKSKDDTSPVHIPPPSVTNAATTAELQRMEFGESLQQLLQRIERV